MSANLGQYKDPRFTTLGDILNARAKIRYGALSHVITARILDSHPSCDELETILEDTQLLDSVFDFIAAEALPSLHNGSKDPTTPERLSPFANLPRNSWSEVLKFERA